MRSEPRWLDAATLVRINAAVVTDPGEPHLTLDAALLESAATRLLNLRLYDDVDDLVRLGASLLFGVARNHPFQHGNKGTAWVAFVLMLEVNGLAVSMVDQDATAQAIVDVITGARDEVWFCELAAAHVR